MSLKENEIKSGNSNYRKPLTLNLYTFMELIFLRPKLQVTRQALGWPYSLNNKRLFANETTNNTVNHCQ